MTMKSDLGLAQIWDLIEIPAASFSITKRERLKVCLPDSEAIAKSYHRCEAMQKNIQSSPRPLWHKILSQFSGINAHYYAKGITLGSAELFDLKSWLYQYQILRSYTLENELNHYILPDLQPLFSLLDPEATGLPSFRLSPLFSESLKGLDQQRLSLAAKLKDEAAQYLSEAKITLELPNLKRDFILPRSNIALIKQIKDSQFFVVNAENIANISFTLADNPKMLNLKQQLMELNNAIETEEAKVLEHLGTQVYSHADSIIQAYNAVQEIGWDYMLADFGIRHDCCFPRISTEGKIQLKKAINLPLKMALKANKRKYQSLDLLFDRGTSLITGPNMGGKTSILQCVAQMVELFKRGIPLPASEAELPVFDFIYINDAKEDQNLSSFGAEVVDFSAALRQGGMGLFLLDEFARGTNPKEGEALATVVISFLAKTPHSAIAATHFTAPTMLKGIQKYQIRGIDISLASKIEAEIGLQNRLKAIARAMDYNLIHVDENAMPPLNAILMARLLGMPEEILGGIDI